MPKYFAYGSNMNAASMALRAPRSKMIGTAKLMRHTFVVTEGGYASVVRHPGGVVYGVLWDLALSDIGALDRYEGASYSKITQPVIKTAGGAANALLYVSALPPGGRAAADYAAEVSEAAAGLNFPHGYLSLLHMSLGLAAPKRLEIDRPKVRVRFASPLDRG